MAEETKEKAVAKKTTATKKPAAATTPSIAIQPLNFSASGVIVLRLIGVEL